VAFVLILAVGAFSSLAVVTVRQSFPQTNGHITIPALGANVTVLRDAYGIPQIYADTPEDLFAAQGFVHAQDRFFEMDLRRHITSGRLSELFGESQYATDVYVRTLGWRQVAEQEAAQLTGATKRYLEAYTTGVNAWLQSLQSRGSGGEISLEYAVLGLMGGTRDIEPWTVADSLAWFKAMAWDLDGNRVSELERALLTQAVGAEQTAELFPEADLTNSAPIVTRGAVKDGRFDPEATAASPARDEQTASTGTTVDLGAALSALQSTTGIDDALSGLLGDARDRLGGSNSWAVSPELSTTGSALLSNDPHLAPSMPSTFTQIGLHCTVKSAACPYDVVGFSFSGVPGVIIGHNADIAWGMTTPYVDTQDLFVEQVQGDQVLYGGEWEPLTMRTERIRVKGESEPRTITVRSSRHGPLISDVDAQLARASGFPLGTKTPGTYAVALSWTALTPGTTAEALFMLNTATDWESFRAAAEKMTSPSQNLLYADRFGNIGYQLPGAIPTRGKGDGNLPRPGWDPSWDWTGTIPFDALPWDYNPPKGYLVAANQTIIGADYPYHLGSDASYGWRSDMISRQIAQRQPLSPQGSVEMFEDTAMGIAADLVPTLLRVKVDDPWVAQAQQVLVGWDYRADADSAAAAYFAMVFEQIVMKTFGDELPEGVSYGGSDRWYAVLRNLVKDPKNQWWDDSNTPQVETRDDILLAAMTQARREITARLSEDPSGWTWGKLHTVALRHQAFGETGIAPLEWMFNRGPREVGGSTGVINAMSWQIGSGDFTVTNAPTMRMLVNFAEIDASVWINQSGVSGHASNPHYDDQFPLWAQGQTIPMPATRSKVEQLAVDKLELLTVG